MISFVRSQLGLTPKHAAQLMCFDHAAQQLAAGEHPAQVAVECGYADQSQLHRHIKAFAGTTPTAVGWLAVDDVAWADSASTLRTSGNPADDWSSTTTRPHLSGSVAELFG